MHFALLVAVTSALSPSPLAIGSPRIHRACRRAALRLVLTDAPFNAVDVQQAMGAVTLAGVCAASAWPRRRIWFSSLDRDAAIKYIRTFPTQAFNLWGVTEWNRLGVKDKPEFSAQAVDRGVRITYYLSYAEKQRRGLTGLVEDGAFLLEVQGGSIDRKSVV